MFGHWQKNNTIETSSVVKWRVTCHSSAGAASTADQAEASLIYASNWLQTLHLIFPIFGMQTLSSTFGDMNGHVNL